MILDSVKSTHSDHHRDLMQLKMPVRLQLVAFCEAGWESSRLQEPCLWWSVGATRFFFFNLRKLQTPPLCVECFVVRNAVLEGAALQALWR